MRMAVLPSNFKLQTIRCLATQIIVQVAVELTTWAYVRRQGKSYTYRVRTLGFQGRQFLRPRPQSSSCSNMYLYYIAAISTYVPS